ncbi:MAG: hydrogenase/urease maturation nickel metallochaperone HypA [Patescibacteria group bacterium]|jgi:hydrogenase nickel incorporation protein HypA/HybF
MHDLIAAQDIVKTALEIAKKNKLKKITRITVKLGKIIEHNQELSSENLQFNFELVKRNTLAENALLMIKKGKGRELSITVVEGEK